MITSQLAIANDEPVFKNQNGYVGIDVGTLIPGHNYSYLLKIGYKLGAQIGYHYKNIRVEEELSYSNTGIKTFNNLDVEYFTAMTNLLLGVNINPRFMLYAGVGAGYADTWFDSSIKNLNFANDLFNGFAYQGILGVSFMYSRNWSVDIEYHYIRCGHSSEMYAHVVDAKFNYLFG